MLNFQRPTKRRPANILSQPLLFDTLYTVSFNLLGQPETLPDLGQVIPEPGKILTLPKLTQLASVLETDFSWDDFCPLYQYNPNNYSNTASMLAETIGTSGEYPILLLVSGKISQENTTEDAIFGAFIANITHDSTDIQRKPQIDQNSTLLFQLSPVHDIFRGNVGRGGWSVVREELCFGERDCGVALVFSKDLKGATVVHSLDENDKAVYKPSAWRDTWSAQVKVKAIEIWGYP